MDQQVTLGLVAFFITSLGAIAGVWWRIEGRLDKTRDACKAEADAAAALATLAGQRLNDHQLYCSQTYIQKSDIKEFRDELMGRLGDVGSKVDHLNDRMDRVIEAAARPAAEGRASTRSRAT